MKIIGKLAIGKNKAKNRARGRFIVIDGSDGTGKATQAGLLVEEMKLNGYEVETVDFPRYGLPSAWFVEQYLINKKYGQLDPYAASVFYAVDRYDASAQIRQWLEEGKVVVSNRYVTSNAGHQGGKITDHAERVKFFKWLDDLEYNIFKIPKPDLNIILHIPSDISRRLAKKKWEQQKEYMNGKKTDLHEGDLQHLKDAEKVFLEIAKLFPNTKLVECVELGRLLEPRQVHNKVWELVRRIALKDLPARS